MMFSFLAALEGGVSIGGQETSSETGSNERRLSAKSGIRAKLFGVVDGELGGDATTQKRDEASFVSQTERHHTAASLFNVLYGYLKDDGLIRRVSSPTELGDAAPGDIVEISGDYAGNPIEDILDLVGALFPYFGNEEPAQAAPQGNPRSGNPSKRATQNAKPASAQGSAQDEGMRIMLKMAEDIKTSPVHDLLFQTVNGMPCVVTVDSEFLTASTSENLREGWFSVVGKVTRIVGPGESINLVRRTVLGAAGPELASQTISMFNGIEGLSLRVPDPIVSGPALQVLPMAIFV